MTCPFWLPATTPSPPMGPTASGPVLLQERGEGSESFLHSSQNTGCITKQVAITILIHLKAIFQNFITVENILGDENFLKQINF